MTSECMQGYCALKKIKSWGIVSNYRIMGHNVETEETQGYNVEIPKKLIL